MHHISLEALCTASPAWQHQPSESTARYRSSFQSIERKHNIPFGERKEEETNPNF
jgi:hypothetical protein